MESHLCYLMHKDIPVMSFVLNDAGMCCEIKDMFLREHIPPGMGSPDSIGNINRFLAKRQLKPQRYDVLKIKRLAVFDPSYFSPFHFVSAFDCYWLKYENEVLSFSDVSFYQKEYEESYESCDVLTYINPDGMGNITVTRDSPNLTINSENPVFVVALDGGKSHILIEAGIRDKSIFLQEIYAKNGLPVVNGTYANYNDSIYYDIENITDETTEYIPFEGYFIDMRSKLENSGISEEELVFNCLKVHDFPDWDDFFPLMLELDQKFSIDRNYSQFGFLRNPDTLEIKSFAPIFCYPITK